MWDGLEGWARFATRDEKGSFNDKKFFKWPEQRDEAIEWAENHTSDFHDVWMSPALFKDNKSAKKSNVKCAQVSWGDYDDGLKEIINPDLAVMSSPGRFHCYWRHQPSKVIEQIEHRNKEHPYADDCWNADRLLRLPGTANTKKSWTSNVLELSPINFLSVAQQEVFYRGVPEGERGRKLFGLACSLAETGAERDSVEALIRDADKRWGKFYARADGEQRIGELVERVYSRVSVSSEQESLPVLGWQELADAPGSQLEWVLQGFLYRGALGTISGPPGVGKTQLSLRLCTNLALGRNFLNFENLVEHGERERILYLSYELSAPEINVFKNAMTDLGPYAQELNERIKFIAPGFSQAWGSKDTQDSIEAAILDHNISGIVVDSLGSTSARSLNDDHEVKTILDFADRLRTGYGVWIIFLHHQRKEDTQGKRRPSGLADLFGSQYIGGRIRTALILWPGETKGDIEVSTPKTSLAEAFDSFWIRRSKLLDFELIEQPRPVIPEKITKKQKDAVEFVEHLMDDEDDDLGF